MFLFGAGFYGWQAFENFHILLGRPGLATNLGPALIGVGGVLVASELALVVYHRERLAAELPGIRHAWRSTGWINASLALAVVSATLALAAMITDRQPAVSSPYSSATWTGWLSVASLAGMAIAVTLMVPAGRGLGPRAVAFRFLKSQLDALTMEEARDFAIGPRTRSAPEAVRRSVRNPYTGLLALFRSALVQRDDGLVVDLLESVARRHLELLRRAHDERERHWVVGAFFRYNDEVLATCSTSGRRDVEPRVCTMLSAWIAETAAHPFEGSILTWMLSDGLASRLAKLENAESSDQVLRATANLALEQLASCQPTETGQRTASDARLNETIWNRRFHDIAEEYRRFLVKVADAAMAEDRPEIARACAEGLAHMAYEARNLTNLTEQQMDRWLTWILMDAESLCIRLIKASPDDLFGIPHEWQLLVEHWPGLPGSCRNIPYATYTRVLMAVAREGIAPWNEWNEFRIWLGGFAGQSGSFPAEALTWGATTLQDVIEAAQSEHKKGNLVGHLMMEVVNVLRWVIPRVREGPHAGELAPRYEQVRADLVALDADVGGLTNTHWEWPGRPEQRRVRNVVAELDQADAPADEGEEG